MPASAASWQPSASGRRSWHLSAPEQHSRPPTTLAQWAASSPRKAATASSPALAGIQWACISAVAAGTAIAWRLRCNSPHDAHLLRPERLQAIPCLDCRAETAPPWQGKLVTSWSYQVEGGEHPGAATSHCTKRCTIQGMVMPIPLGKQRASIGEPPDRLRISPCIAPQPGAATPAQGLAQPGEAHSRLSGGSNAPAVGQSIVRGQRHTPMD